MNSRNRFVFGLLTATALLGGSARAQTPDADRAYVIGLGGAAVSSVNAGLFGGGLGMSIHRDVQVFGEFGRMQDVLPDFTKEDLRIVEQEMQAQGMTLVAKSKAPTAYAIGGLRYLVPTGAALRPYVSVAGGVAHVMPGPTFVLDGVDVTSTALQFVDISKSFTTRNRPLATIGGGVTVNLVNHVKVDVGYKYSRIFVKTDYLQAPESPHQHSKIDVHRLQFGLGFTF